jgi:hypothetical protein
MNISAARLGVWVVAIALVSTITCAFLHLFVVQGNVKGDVDKDARRRHRIHGSVISAAGRHRETLRRWADSSRFLVDWIVCGGAKLVLGLASAAIGSAVALLLGS